LNSCVAFSKRGQQGKSRALTGKSYAKIEKISQDNAVANERYQQILTSMNELKADVKELKERPGKNGTF
jgi:cell division protein FtsB